MCSTSNNEDSGGRGGDVSLTSSSSRKQIQKRHKIPKRGPGVAELEKILREQEKKSGSGDPEHDQRRFSRPYFLSSDHQRYFQQPVVFNHNNSSNDNSNYSNLIARTSQVVHSNNNSSGVSRGRGWFFPVQKFSPVVWTNHNEMSSVDERKLEGGISFWRVVPKQYFQSSTSVISHFPESSSSFPSSAGLYHPMEPPSSQRSRHNYTSIGPQDQKFVGIKRPLSVDNHYQVPQLPSQNQRALDKHNPNICKPMPRDAKWDAALDFNYIPNCSSEVPDGNLFEFVSLNTPAVSLPFQAFQQQFPKFDQMIAFQGNIKDLNQKSTGSDPDKPFYSFLPSNDPTGTKGALCGIEKGNKSGEDGVDLNLKLSTT